MPRLIDRVGVREDRFTAVAAADTPAAGSAVLVSFADFQADRARWLAELRERRRVVARWRSEAKANVGWRRT